MEWLENFKISSEHKQPETLPNSGGLPKNVITNILQICCDTIGLHEERKEIYQPGYEPPTEEEMAVIERKRAFPGAEPFLHRLPTLKSREVPLKFSYVSRSWRQIVLSTPGLWYRFQLHMVVDTDDSAKAGLQRLCEEAKIWLARSGNYPLTFTLSIVHSAGFSDFEESKETLDLYGTLFEILSSHVSRWRNVNFVSRFNGRTLANYSHDTIAGISDTTKAFLAELDQSLYPKSPFVSFISPKGETPNLKVFQFLLTGFNLTKTMLVARNMTILNLESGQPVDILSILESLPNLRWLHSTASSSKHDPIPRDSPLEHKSLQMLYLSHRRERVIGGDVPHLSRIMDCLKLPSIREVLLTDYVSATDPVLPALANLIQRSAQRTFRVPSPEEPRRITHHGPRRYLPDATTGQALVQAQTYTPYYLETEPLFYDPQHTGKLILAALQMHSSRPTIRIRQATANQGYKHEDLPRMTTLVHFRADMPDTPYPYDPVISVNTEDWSGSVFQGEDLNITFHSNKYPESSSFKDYYALDANISVYEFDSDDELEGEIEIKGEDDWGKPEDRCEMEEDEYGEYDDDEEEEDMIIDDEYDYFEYEEDEYNSYEEEIIAQLFPCCDCDDDWD